VVPEVDDFKSVIWKARVEGILNAEDSKKKVGECHSLDEEQASHAASLPSPKKWGPTTEEPQYRRGKGSQSVPTRQAAVEGKGLIKINKLKSDEKGGRSRRSEIRISQKKGDHLPREG